MMLESQNVPSAMEVARREGTRKRVLSCEWCGQSVSDLVSTVCALATQPTKTSTQAYQEQVASALSLCDNLSTAGEVAANSIQVIADERLQLAGETADIDASVAREEVEVQRLRKLLRRERRVVDHRKQLEGVASMLLTLPPRPSFVQRLAQAKTASASVEESIKLLETERDQLGKELRLLIHCAASVEDSAKRVADLATSSTSDEADTSAPNALPLITTNASADELTASSKTDNKEHPPPVLPDAMDTSV